MLIYQERQIPAMLHDNTAVPVTGSRLDPAYARRRLAARLDACEDSQARAGLRRVAEHMERMGLPAALQLHYVTALLELGRVAREGHPRRRP